MNSNRNQKSFIYVNVVLSGGNILRHTEKIRHKTAWVQSEYVNNTSKTLESNCSQHKFQLFSEINYRGIFSKCQIQLEKIPCLWYDGEKANNCGKIRYLHVRRSVTNGPKRKRWKMYTIKSLHTVGGPQYYYNVSTRLLITHWLTNIRQK